MRKLADYKILKDNDDFWLLFLMNNFPESLDVDTDKTMSEIISHNYNINKEWVDKFTGYYEGVFDLDDGYIEEPTTLKIELSTPNNLFIEFHPGDTIYFIDENEIGCTGPEYSIQKITWTDFCKYTETMVIKDKFLLLPMVVINHEEQEELRNIIFNCLKLLPLHEEDFNRICDGIIENCVSI